MSIVQKHLCTTFSAPDQSQPEEQVPVATVLEKILVQSVPAGDARIHSFVDNSLPEPLVRLLLQDSVISKLHRVAYAYVEQVRVYNAAGQLIPQSTGQSLPDGYVVQSSLNGFNGGVGILGIQGKINTDVNQLSLASQFNRFGAFCINSPYEVAIFLQPSVPPLMVGDPIVLGDFLPPIAAGSQARIEYQIRLGVSARVDQTQRLESKGKKCCAPFPCGKLEKVIDECKFFLARGHRQFNSYEVQKNASQPTQAFSWEPELCDCKCKHLLANAWCLSVQILNIAPALQLSSAVLTFNNQTALVQIAPPVVLDLQNTTVAVGQGVQPLLSLISQQTQVDGGVAALSLSFNTDRYAFQIDCPLKAQLTLQLVDTPSVAQVEVLWRFQYVTCTNCE